MAALAKRPDKTRRVGLVIGKQDILERAQEWQLRPSIVEKDYVLGWVLAAIAQHRESSTNWVFKGGTCLKKCYFETYRFSEDFGLHAPSGCCLRHREPYRDSARGHLDHA